MSEPQPESVERHHIAVAVDGDVKESLDRAVTNLTTNGFVIEERRPELVSLSGPGLRSTNQNPVLGASNVEIRSGIAELSMSAELGALRSLNRFVTWFPPPLTLLIVLPWAVLVPLGVVPKGALWPVAIVVGVQLPVWALIGFWIRRSLRRRTVKALDSVVRNAAQLG